MEDQFSFMDLDLFEIAYNGCFSVLNLALDHLDIYNFQVNSKDHLGNSLLHYAARKGNIEATQKLLALSASPDILDEKGSTPLHLACIKKHIAVVRILLDHAAKIDIKNYFGYTPLSLAVRCGDEALVRYLIKKGADITATNNVYESLLHIAVASRNEKLVELFIRRGKLGVDSRNSCDETPLMMAVKYGIPSIVDMLLDYNVDHSIKDHNKRNLIHLAVYGNHLHICQILIMKNVSVNELDNEGRSPLHVAAEMNYVNLIKLLVKNGAKINQQDLDGYTPLHVAASNIHSADSVEVLLKLGAKRDWLTFSGELPFHRAAASGNDKVLMSLYKKEFLQLKTKDGYSAKMFAIELEKISVLHLLENLEKAANFRSSRQVK
ncbi:putative ankyrin repeat protein RF_0381 [Euwallacea fornicatus]|uniref:putative ankyrin repeat protein RF_0381 n=1 Tax=Euwallacea fornicatus TaxID=995702 RepID=UPI00338D4FB1